MLILPSAHPGNCGATRLGGGYPWVQKPIRLGGAEMDYALSLMTEFRVEDPKSKGSVTGSKR